MEVVSIPTERLVLRNLLPEDVQTMFDYRNSELCARYQRGQTRDREGIAELIERRRRDEVSVDAPFMLAIAQKDTGCMVGEVVVMPCDGTISLGYTISYKCHRKGYAYEALTALMSLLHARYPEWDFVCFVDPENYPSMALLGKLGYRDLGYIPSKDSRAFGKWLRPDTEAEIAAAVQK